MSTFRKRLLRRLFVVVLVLGTMGYFFGQLFLAVSAMYAANASDPANQRVLWQTPLVMAGFGLVLTAVMEGAALAVRRRRVLAKAAVPVGEIRIQSPSAPRS